VKAVIEIGSYGFLMAPAAAAVMSALGKAEQVDMDFSGELGHFCRLAKHSCSVEMRLLRDQSVLTKATKVARKTIPEKASEDCPRVAAAVEGASK
jgi:hypothetical protein